jgi:lactoylglutathione lyase
MSPQSGFRLAHTMIRVVDLDRTLDFYTRLLGMRVLRQSEYPGGRFTNTFIGYDEEDASTVIELTWNWDQTDPYDLGNGWGHLALEVPDVYATCEQMAAEGTRIARPPGPMKHGTRVIAFIEDPNGYKIELLEPL